MLVLAWHYSTSDELVPHRRQMRKLKSYSGILAEPIPPRVFRTSMRAGKLHRLTVEKLDAVCRYYGVDRHNIKQDHVLTLARRYVPGFQIGRSKPVATAAGKKWDDVRLARLWLLFRAIRPEFG